MQNLWISETRQSLICIDRYDNGVPQGWLYSPLLEGKQFLSLSQLLLTTEAMLEENRSPQAYTATRKFSDVSTPQISSQEAPPHQRGRLATFELSVLFRQNTSWQGLIKWKERGQEQSFRSVLELVMLMDSALRAN